MVQKRSIFQVACTSLACLTPFATACAFHDLQVPAIPYEEDAPEAVDPFANESPVATRVAQDARALAAMAGDEAGAQLEPLLAILYNAGKSDDERLQAVKSLNEIARSLDQQSAEQRSLAGQILRRTRVAEAALNALKSAGEAVEAREITNRLLVRLTVDYENTVREDHSEMVREDYQSLKLQYPAVYEAIRPVMMDEYFNYNLHFVLSEPMLSRLVSDYRTEDGGVAECILGAWVTGSQSTDTSVRADIKPSTGSGMFQLLVDGHTTSNTQGRKSPATVYTHGDHTFSIVKPTYFDGTSFSTGPANMDVHAYNKTVGLKTDFDGIPILRGIVRNIAMNEVANKKHASEAIAARKLADQALPRFESEVGKKFSEANDNVQNNILNNLRNKGIAPQSYSARSSETHIAVSSRTMSPQSLSAPAPPTTPAPARGVAVQMHESAINAAIDSLGISGQMKIEEVIERIESSLEDFLNREVVLRPEGNTNDDKTEFDFTAKDSIRIRFDEGKVVFILRTGFYQPENDRRIPQHVFEIPMGIELREGNICLIPPSTDARGILSLKPQPIEGKASLRSVAQARGIAKEILDKTFTEPLITVDPNLNLQMADKSDLSLQVTRLDITDGWITVVFQ